MINRSSIEISNLERDFFYRDFIARLHYITTNLKVINKIIFFKNKNKIKNV